MTTTAFELLMPPFAMRGRSDQGYFRTSNEDTYTLNETLGFAVIADGLGGQAGGEIASRKAAEIVTLGLTVARHELEKLGDSAVARRLGAIAADANDQILRLANASPGLRGMGTTLDAVVVLGAAAFIMHVGDSRVYRVRAGTARQITQDHSLAALLAETGRFSPRESARFASILLRAVGASDDLVADIVRAPVIAGDVLVLCTDGVWSHIKEPFEIAEMVQCYGANAADELVKLALDRGGEDNATAVTVIIQSPD